MNVRMIKFRGYIYLLIAIQLLVTAGVLFGDRPQSLTLGIALVLSTVLVIGLLFWERAITAGLRRSQTEQRRLERKIADSQALLDETGKITGIGGWEHDLASGKAIWTRSLYDIIEIEGDEPPGVDAHLDYYPEADRHRLQAAYEKCARDGTPFNLELTVRTARGRPLWARVTGEPVVEQGRICKLRGTLQDITIRKKAEDRLRRSEQTLRTVLDASPNCVMVRDEEGRYLLANKAAADLCEVPVDEMDGVTIIELATMRGVDEAAARRLHEEDARVIDTHQTLTDEKRPFTIKDGSIRWFRTTKAAIALPDHPRCVLEVATDITGQVAAEEQQALLFTAIGQSPEAIVITDRQGRIEYVNPAFETITGYSRAEATGCNPRILKSGQHDETFYRHMWETLARGKVWNGRIINQRKNGERYTEEASISPVLTDQGQTSHYVAVKRDISRELETETHLRQAQKMEAIGTLAGGVAHDFNNILTSTIGFAELALSLAEKESDLEEYLKEIYLSGMRARDLVAQILAFARQSEESVSPVQVGLIVKETVRLLRSTIPTSIEIRHSVESDGTTLADPTQIHQVCMNLCTNAVHAMEERGGRLEIRLEDRLLDNGYRGMNGELPSGRYLVLSIADTGSGISPEIMDAIFEPYFTTKDVGEGTGLGLSVVHGIVKGCGGGLEVVSQPGKGTTFTVFLPRVDDQRTSSQAEEPVRTVEGTEHLLIVDDELVIARMLGKAFERQGYQVSVRTSSVEALALFRHKPEAFDLVITDMTMPNLTGDLLAAEMLRQRPELPVILCTGYNKKISPETAASLGIRSMVMKPLSNRELIPLVRGILDGTIQGQN